MEYLTLKEIKEMFLHATQKIEEKKEEINKINVFPVPDQDTGTNLAKTLEGIKERVENKEFNNLEEIKKEILEGALISAQGNVGVIFTGFLLGFFSKLNQNFIGVKDLAEAFEEGKRRALKSIINPKEGTILDVIEATAITFKKESEKEKDMIKIFEKTIEKAREALLKTKEKMEILKKANVVDAGGFGFLIILESFLEVLKPSFGEEKKLIFSEEIRKIFQVLSKRYEVVALILNPQIEEEKIKEKLKSLGDCLDIIQIENKLKIHIHTDYPEEVREALRKIGKIENLRIEDMRKEIAGEPSVKKTSIALVVENVASLSKKIVEKYQIEVAEAKFEWPELEKIEGENIYQKIKKAYQLGIETRPQTSQVSPGEYFKIFEEKLKKFDKILALTVSSNLSGCYNCAIQAREMFSENEKERIFIFDTKNGAAGQALFVLRAIELIQEQREIEEILKELEKLISKTKLYIIFGDPKGAEMLGRITKKQANWIRRMKKLGIYPIIEMKNGKLEKGGIILAKSEAEALFKKAEKETKKERKLGKKIRAVINHADNLEKAKELKEMLKKIEIETSFISEAPPIIWAVTGLGTLILGFQPVN